MSERPTPMTDDHVNELRRNPEVSGCGRTLEFARNLERQLTEAREEIGRIRKFATVNGVAELERQLAAKTEECEGWEKMYREALMAALTDRTREQRDALADTIKRGVSEFDRIDAATPWSESEPKWWIAWSEWAQDAKSTLAAVKETTQDS